MNLNINKIRSFILLVLAGFTILAACNSEDDIIPEVSAFFKTRNIIDEDNPLEAPADVVFVNASKNGLSYKWDFGNGYLKNHPDRANAFEGVSPDTVRFPLPGSYEIKVTVSGGKDGDKTFSKIYEVLKETPKISYAPEDILVDTTVYFNVSFFLKEGATPSFEWLFEDGEPATSNLQSPEVKFKSAGLKVVTLLLNDGEEVLTVNTRLEIKEELAPTLFFTDMNAKRIFKKRVFSTVDIDEAEPIVQTSMTLLDGSKPMTMLVDNNRVYYSNVSNHTSTSTFGEIVSFHINGTDRRVAASGGSGNMVPFSFTIVGNDIYYTDRYTGIFRVNKNGESLPINMDGLWLNHSNTEFYGNGIGWGAQNGTVTYHNGTFWWAKNSNSRGLYKIHESKPTNASNLVTGEKLFETYAIRSFVLSEDASKIYFFINQPAGSNPIGMYVANSDGTNITLIEEYAPGADFDGEGGTAQFMGVTGIAILGDHVYWGFRDVGNAPATSGIKRAKLDGSEAEMYLSGYVPYGIAVDKVPR